MASPLPADAPNAAAWLHEKAGYRTALIGKAHFEPAFDLQGRWFENAHGAQRIDRSVSRLRTDGTRDAWASRRMALLAAGCNRSILRISAASLRCLTAQAGGDTGAPEVKYNPIPREHYHTDWVADRTLAFLDSLDANENWFVWMSFPDPHHPWDPPEKEARRINWRDLRFAGRLSALTRAGRKRSSPKNRAIGSTGTRAGSAIPKADR